jgi:hypothetical protein
MLSAPSGGSLGTDTATGTIRNDDSFGPVDQPEGVIRGTDRADALASGAGAIYLPGAGSDVVLISPAATAGKTAVVDAGAGDVVQVAGGLGIVEALLTPDALGLDLASGGRVQVLNASLALFEPGGNVTTGAAGPRLSYADFAESVLGVTVPTSGLVTGAGAIVPEATGTRPVTPVAGPPAPPDGVIRGTGREDTLLTGAGTILLPGGGADRVIVSEAATPSETSVVEGATGDTLELVAGLEIAEFVITPTALALTLATGAAVQLLQAPALTFAPGANATAAETALVLDYESFAETVLGTPVPATGITTGGPVTIPDPMAVTSADTGDLLELL